MTYCVAIRLDQGLVFGTDSRTNAGVDYVTTYRKMHTFQPAPDRLFVILSAGNLATTQEINYHIQRDLDYPTGGPNLANVRYIFEAAEYLGQLSQAVQQRHDQALSAAGISGETSLILGGQIEGQAPEIMLIYPQGNYISASDETPYLQVGETKYGKPVLDRLLRPELSLELGARVALTSLDGTARSNVTVGAPFEIALYLRDSFTISHQVRFEQDAEYLDIVRQTMNRALEKVIQELPPFDWETQA